MRMSFDSDNGALVYTYSMDEQNLFHASMHHHLWTEVDGSKMPWLT